MSADIKKMTVEDFEALIDKHTQRMRDKQVVLEDAQGKFAMLLLLMSELVTNPPKTSTEYKASTMSREQFNNGAMHLIDTLQALISI